MFAVRTPRATRVAPPVQMAPTTHAAARTAMPMTSSTLRKLHPLGSAREMGLPRHNRYGLKAPTVNTLVMTGSGLRNCPTSGSYHRRPWQIRPVTSAPDEQQDQRRQRTRRRRAAAGAGQAERGLADRW